MNKYDILEYGFACFYIFVLCAISFVVGVGIMWVFHDLLGVSPYWISGAIGIGYALNSVSRLFDRKKFK